MILMEADVDYGEESFQYILSMCHNLPIEECKSSQFF
jgi:hypothetical protein